MSKKKKRYTATDAASDAVEIIVVIPVSWLLSQTIGRILDVT